jgi:MFS family permease
MSAEGALKQANTVGFPQISLATFLAYIVEQTTWVGTILFAYDRFGSRAGLVAAGILIVAAIVTPAVTRQLERTEPIRAARTNLASQIIAISVTALAVRFDSSTVSAWVMLTIVATLVSAMPPAMYATLPKIAKGGEGLAAQNVVMSWVQNGGLIVGPMAAAILLKAGDTVQSGLTLTLVVSAVLLAVATVCLAPLAASELQETNAAPARDHGTQGDEIALRKVPALRTLFAITLGSYLVLGSLDVLFVPIAAAAGIGEDGAGWIAAAYGFGGLLSYFGTRFVLGRERLAVRLVVLGILGSIPLALLAVTTTTAWATIVLITLSGAFRSLFGVIRQTLIQRSAPAGTLLRVTGLFQVALSLGYAFGALIPLVTGTVARACIATGLLVPATLLIAAKGLREVDNNADVPVTEIALLGCVSVLRSLRPASLEALARASHMRRYHRGLPVVLEGDVGQEMFVVVDGEVEVLRGEQPVKVLSRGDVFGEVALLRNQPRNATVLTRSETQLLAIPRDQFVSFVGLHQNVAVAFDDMVHERSHAHTLDETSDSPNMGDESTP